MAGEGPPFLTVGTDVSAKYRGAFCEAKVKVVKKLVKCKINFKSGTSCIVSDDFVKGTLKIGAKVEAKMTESSPYEDGTIMKLNDASLYTVVFDDGDEKTLRRTLLCLQGEKHFHESETLDHLPLTDPENFGTPVIKDSSKTRRKRRTSNRSQRSESEEEEEDDEDSDGDSPKKQRKEEPEDAVGKIVIVEMNEKRKNSFFPALVVDPSCTKDVQTKGKDYIVARSFKDNKFYTVSRSSRKPYLSKDHTYKGDVASLKAANEKAVTFIDTGQLPSNWDMELLKKKNKSKQVQVVASDHETSEDSSDDEYDMEKDAWLASLHKFMEERGTPINKPPVLGFRDLNLYKLYKLVQDQGGCRKVTDRQMWRHIMSKMGIPVPATQQPYNIHTSYNKYLFAFEEFNRKMGPGPRVFTRTRRRSFDRGWISPPAIIGRQRSMSIKQAVKEEPSDREEEEESPSKKRVTRKKGEDVSKPPEQEESKRETREAKSRSKEADKEERDTTDRDEKKTAKKSSKEDKVKERSKDTPTKNKSSKDVKDKVKDKPTKDDNVKEKVTDKPAKADTAKDKPTKDDKVKERSRDTPSKDDKVKERSRDTPSKDDKVKERSKDTPTKDGDEKMSEKTNDGKEKLKDTKGKDKAKDEKGERAKEEKGDRTREERMEERMEEKELESKARERGKERKAKSKPDSGREEESTSPIPPVHHITGAGYEVGERVLIHYGRGRTEKLYEAKVVDIELKGKDHVFTVHYTGWNNRYDEAIKKSRIVGSAEKKKKKQLTPKGKGDREKGKKDVEKKDKEEQLRMEKEEADRREQEENERRAREESELKEKEQAERLEKARAEKEREEKERQEKLEREKKEKLERERLEKEQKEKEEREKLEREKQERELKERLEKEQQERERKEKQEKERKEKQEKDRREKLEREKREKEKLELERQEKELADKAREAERERKEKAGKEGKKTPTGKRGRPSLSSKTSPLPQTPPRTTPTGRGKSLSPGSVFSQRSMRSDRKSLTESPFALGLNVRARSKRSSTGEYRTGAGDDSDSELDELYEQSESQQSTQDSEDSQMKDTRVQEPDEHDDNESTKTEDYAATLTKISERKPSFDEDIDEGPPTLTAEVAPETVEARLQEAESEAPKVEEVDKVSGEKERRLKIKKESKIRLRKSIDKERDVKDSANESLKGEKTPGKDGAKGHSELDDSKEKIDDTPVLERQIPMEAELKEKLEELKQETKGSASDADKPTEKKKGRRKGRKSIERRKRSKTEAEVAEVSEKSEASEASEPKKKHAKVDKRKSDKGGKRSSKGGLETKTPADNTDSDFGTSSIDDKSIPGTSKSFMTTPPTTPESSPKMPSSPARDEDPQMKTEDQSSNKSDSDALIEVANLDDRESSQARENNASLASSAPPPRRGTQVSASQQPSPKKRRRGMSESEQTKKRRKHSRRRQSSISERRLSAKEQSNNNSSDTDESRSESRLTSSSAKRQLALKKYADSLPPSRVAESSEQDGSQKQGRWNFLVDLSNVKEPDERIAIIQHQLTELRSVYLQLKQEVATIDRRRKKFRKKEREAAQVMAGVAMGHCLSHNPERMESGGS